MEMKKLIWGILAVALLAVLVFNPYSQMILGMFIGIGHIRKIESKLQNPQVYRPVAERLALYCQSDQNLLPTYMSSAWFPDVLAQLGHGRGSVATNSAQIEMGGGFHHYGYRLELDEAASGLQADSFQLVTAPQTRTNCWKLFMYSEGSQDKLLTTLAMPATNHLTAEDLQKLAAGAYDKFIAEDPAAYKGKVLSLLRFGKMAEARDACSDWVKREPEVWLPHFTLAHVRCRLGQTDLASAEFREWVKANPNFAHYNYLALFSYREGNTNEALKAVQLSLGQPFIEPPNTDGNKFFLGFNGAMMAYLAGDYDLCLTVCDRMLADSRQEQWWRRKLLKLRAAVLLNKGDQSSALLAIGEAEKLQDKRFYFGLEGMAASDSYLRKAIETKNVSALTVCGPWLDEMESWFTPFDVDETGIHGRDDIPSPYPKAWKSDAMRPDASGTNEPAK